MSATPPAVVSKSVHSLLNSLRAPIFMTNYNPTNARLGTKYIRRSLKGPKMIQYYDFPNHSIKRLNDPGRGGAYTGWNGVIPVTEDFIAPSASIGISESAEASGSGSGSSEASGTAEAPGSGPSTLTRVVQPDASIIKAHEAADRIAAMKNAGMTPGGTLHEDEFVIEVQKSIKTKKAERAAMDDKQRAEEDARRAQEVLPAWLRDAHQEDRVNKLEARRRIGKVKPKKGAGKRAQVGKKR